MIPVCTQETGQAVGNLFASGRVVELIIGFVVLEGVLLVVYNRCTGRGIKLDELAGHLVAGIFLLLALRAALLRAQWGTIALFLTAALLAHVAQLWRRWR